VLPLSSLAKKTNVAGPGGAAPDVAVPTSGFGAGKKAKGMGTGTNTIDANGVVVGRRKL
jgi:hypothetical protein